MKLEASLAYELTFIITELHHILGAVPFRSLDGKCTVPKKHVYHGLFTSSTWTMK